MTLKNNQRFVRGYEGLYMINTDGKVTSLHVDRPNPTVRKSRVELQKNGYRRCFSLPRLVLRTFDRSYKWWRRVYFIDGDKTNCTLSNLTQNKELVKNDRNR